MRPANMKIRNQFALRTKQTARNRRTSQASARPARPRLATTLHPICASAHQAHSTKRVRRIALLVATDAQLAQQQMCALFVKTLICLTPLHTPATAQKAKSQTEVIHASLRLLVPRVNITTVLIHVMIAIWAV